MTLSKAELQSVDRGSDRRDAPATLPVLWRRPWWLRPRVLAVLWAAVLVYGSLVPFDFDPAVRDAFATDPGQAIRGVLASPSWVGATPGASSYGVTAAWSDVVTNVVLYLPLGLAVGLAVRRRARWHGAPLAFVVIVGLSYTIECVQGLTFSRVASWPDVVTNTSAGVVAAMAARWAMSLGSAIVFGVYRTGAGVVLPAWDALNRWRRRPVTWVVLGAAAAAALVLGGQATRTKTSHASKAELAPPFVDVFRLPYDEAAATLCLAGLGMAAISALAAAMIVRRRSRMNTLSVVAASVTAGTLIAWTNRHGSGAIDLTWPALAGLVALAMSGGAASVVHLARRTCRRRTADPVPVDRRRRRHDYRFALR